MAEDNFDMDVAAYLLKREYDSGKLAFDKVEEAGTALSDYYERVRQEKRRPFSALMERQERQRQDVREMFRTRAEGVEPGDAGPDDAELAKLTAPVPATPTLRRQIANVAQFALDSGNDVETVSANYPLFVRAYTKHEMGRETATDDEVYEHMGAKHDLRDHLKASAWQMGVLGERPNRAFRTWVKQARKEQLKGWQQEKLAEYEKAYRDQYQMSRTATEVGIPAAMAVSGVPGAGFLMVPGRPEPLVKGVDGSLGMAREDGKGLREVARPDPYRGLVISDVHQAHRVVDEAGTTPVYMPSQVPADAQMRDEREAARGIARVERPSGRPGMAPVLEAPGEFSMERPYDFAGNARAAESSIVGSRTRNEEHYAAEGKRHGAFLESLQTEINAKRLEINQRYADEAQRNAKLEEFSKSVQERYAKHLEERAAALTGAHTAFESGLLSAQVYRQMGLDMKAVDLLENFQEEVAMKESLERARDVAKRVALGQDGSDTPHIQITPEYRELRAEALGEPPRIIYQVGRSRGSKAFPGKTSQEVEEIARRWKGSPIVEVDTVDKRLAALNKRFAPQIAESRERMRAALGPILDEDEALMAAFESQAIFDSASELPKGVVELLLNPRFWGERAPFGGGFVEMSYLASVAASAEKLKRGEQMTDGESIMLREALIEMKRENSWWGQVLDFTVSSASFGVELGTTGGVATATKKGAMELAGLGLRRLATVEGRQEVENLLLTRLALGTLGLAGQTAVASASHVASKAYTDLHFEGLEMHRGADGKVIFGLEAGYQPGSPWEKLKGAFVHQMVENGSEKLGGFIKVPGVAKAFQRMSAGQQEAVVKEGLFQAFAQKMGAEKAARFLARANERLAKMEIQGMPQEVLEEYVAALGHTVFEGEAFSPPSLEDITALMTSLVISRGGSLAVEGVMGNDGSGKEAQMPAEVGDGAQGQKGAVPGNATGDASILKQLEGTEEQQTVKVNGEAGANAEGRLSFSGANAQQRQGGGDVNAWPDTFEMLRTDETSRRGAAVQDKDLNVILQTMASRAETPETVRVEPNPPMRPETERSYVVTINEGGEVVMNVEKNGTVWVDTQGGARGCGSTKGSGWRPCLSGRSELCAQQPTCVRTGSARSDTRGTTQAHQPHGLQRAAAWDHASLQSLSRQ